jgi:type I restriction enzyme S subunit
MIGKSALAPGDLAVVRTGAPGQCCVIPDSLPEANCSDLVIARPGPGLFADFGAIVINSSLGQGFVKSEQVGVAQAHFNVSSMKRAPLNLPSLSEQQEIVRRTQHLFILADQLEARLNAARKVVDRLTPALLAKAFRGELVPQDPNDEPASELLAKIKSAQADALHVSPRRRAKQSTRRQTMSISDQDSVKAAILNLKTDRFSFDELRDQAGGDYETLKGILFQLLEEPSPVVRQVFDQEAKAMKLERIRP